MGVFVISEFVMIEQLVQLGVAGIMGVLWVWERMHSRKREQQLTEAHQRISRREDQLDIMVELVKQNTKAMIDVEHTQIRICELLDQMCHHQSESFKDIA